VSAKALRAWYGVHKWTSLVCTLFLLLLCLTGLPLIFKAEIDVWTGSSVDPPATAGRPFVSLDRLIEDARRRRPDDKVLHVSRKYASPAWLVGLGADAAEATTVFKYDARTGAMIHDVPPYRGAMATIRALHVDLLAGDAGTLFVGAVGLCFVASMVSGVVLYAPYMRKLAFGTVRAARAPRLRWLDLHNLLGIAAAAWLLLLGVTGAVNGLALPLLAQWERTTLPEMMAPWSGQAVPATRESVQDVVDTARAAVPSMDVSFIGFPGSRSATARHYLVFMRGTTTLTSSLTRALLVDAESGRIADSRTLPWYLTALLLVQPLHFGDYGGLPLKIIWALFDIVAIAVLGSGLYLWLARRSQQSNGS
jgi:uncharacterized iron-regulated membrane protein